MEQKLLLAAFHVRLECLTDPRDGTARMVFFCMPRSPLKVKEIHSHEWTLRREWPAV